MKTRLWRIAGLLFLSALPLRLAAESLSLSFYQYATDNLFQNRYGEPDKISLMDLSFEKSFPRISLFGGGGYSYLHENPGLSFASLDTGVDYLLPVNENAAAYFSLTGAGFFFRSDYKDFNHSSLKMNAAYKSYFGQSSILRSQFAFELRNYAYPLFDYSSQALSLSLDKYFRSKTTLKLETAWGRKHFAHPYLPEASSAGTAAAMDGTSRGRQAGKWRVTPKPGLESKGAGIQILSLAGLAAQGLGKAVGLSLSGQRQWTVSGENPFQSVEEFYMVENPTYDNFAWEGWGLTGRLTVLIPWDIELKTSYTKSDKRFPGIESVSGDPSALGPTRKDRRDHFETRLEKDFSRFSVFISYSYIANRSNDPLFTWKSHFAFGGIEWNLSFGRKK